MKSTVQKSHAPKKAWKQTKFQNKALQLEDADNINAAKAKLPTKYNTSKMQVKRKGERTQVQALLRDQTADAALHAVNILFEC